MTSKPILARLAALSAGLAINLPAGLGALTAVAFVTPAEASPACEFIPGPASDPGDVSWDCPPQPGGRHAPPPPPSLVALAVGSNLRSGAAYNDASESEVRAQALAACRTSGGTNCRVVFMGAVTCGAVVVSQAEAIWRVGRGGGTGWASANGRLMCQRAGGTDCRVSVSVCSDASQGAPYHDDDPYQSTSGRIRR